MVALSVRKRGRQIAALAVFLGALTVLLVLDVFPLWGEDSVPYALGLGAVAALLLWLLIPWNFKRVYRKPGQRTLFEERTAILDERGLSVEYVNGIATFMPWSTITRVEWTRDLLLLYIVDYQYIIVPRRALTPTIEQQIRDSLAAAKLEPTPDVQHSIL